MVYRIQKRLAVAGKFVPGWLYNIGTTVLNGGVSMVVFFFVNKIIFPEGVEERLTTKKSKKKPRIVRYYNSGLRSLLQVFLGLLFAYWYYIVCKSENQYTDKWEIGKKNFLFFWNKKCECILKPMRFSRSVKCGRIHIENINERLSR